MPLRDEKKKNCPSANNVYVIEFVRTRRCLVLAVYVKRNLDVLQTIVKNGRKIVDDVTCIFSRRGMLTVTKVTGRTERGLKLFRTLRN